MKFCAVTTYALKHYEQYAKRCIETFHLHWRDIELKVYDDESLEDRSDWLKDFKGRHKNKPTDNYRLDAVRFSHKVAAIELAFNALKDDALVWMDADILTHAEVTNDWLTSLLGEADFAYLERKHKTYPETGFMIFRNNLRAKQFIRHVVDLYREDTLFKLKEWHDGFLWEHCRANLSDWGALACIAFPGCVGSHPFVNSELGSRMDHLKGKRKLAGKSYRNDLQVSRTEEYWLS